MWLGTYKVAQGCDQSTCCCAQTTTITAGSDAKTYVVTGSDLAGLCGSNPPSTVTGSVARPTSDTFTYSVNGQSHQATRQSDGGIYDQNNASGSCSATLAKQSATNNTSRGSVASASLVLVLALLAMLAVARN